MSQCINPPFHPANLVSGLSFQTLDTGRSGPSPVPGPNHLPWKLAREPLGLSYLYSHKVHSRTQDKPTISQDLWYRNDIPVVPHKAVAEVSKIALRHSRVQLLSLIGPHSSAPAALASLLFDPRGPQIIEKTQCFATVLPFRAPGSSFFLDFLFFDFLFSLLFSSLLWLCPFHLSILSNIWLLNFLRLLIYTQ